MAALNANRIQAVALTAPATVRARKMGLKPLLDISKLEANWGYDGGYSAELLISSFQSECQTRVERVREFRQAGHIGEAISELERFLNGPRIIFPEEIQTIR